MLPHHRQPNPSPPADSGPPSAGSGQLARSGAWQCPNSRPKLAISTLWTIRNTDPLLRRWLWRSCDRGKQDGRGSRTTRRVFFIWLSPTLRYRKNCKMCVKTAIKTHRTPTRLPPLAWDITRTRVADFRASAHPWCATSWTMRSAIAWSTTSQVILVPGSPRASSSGRSRIGRTLIGAWAIE